MPQLQDSHGSQILTPNLFEDETVAKTAMYFDIVLVYCHQKQKGPHKPETKHNRGDGGGTSHSARSSHCTVRQASHGSPMLASLFLE